MRWGAHLPLIDFGEGGARVGELCDYVRAARELGCDTVSANDHLLWRRPWLDGLTASVGGGGARGRNDHGDVGGPARGAPPRRAREVAGHPCCAARRAVHRRHRSRVGSRGLRGGGDAVPGAMDAVRRGRAGPASSVAGRGPLEVGSDAIFAPLPNPAPQVWVASWGSRLRLRDLAGTADGWFASGYNTDPARYAAARAQLDAELRRAGRDPAEFPDAIATMWLYVTSDAEEAATVVNDVLAPVLGRDPRTLARFLPVGTADHCITVLNAYARAGARRILLWPVRSPMRQLATFAEQVAPHVTG